MEKSSTNMFRNFSLNYIILDRHVPNSQLNDKMKKKKLFDQNSSIIELEQSDKAKARQKNH